MTVNVKSALSIIPIILMGFGLENETMEEMKYKVVNGSGIDEVSETSNKLMDQGYVPAGGVNYIPNEQVYTQVMFWEPKSIMGTP